MSREPNTPQDPQSLEAAAQVAPGVVARRKYEHPRLKRLGSVRDLTLGSPMQPFGDLTGAFQRGPPM